MEDYLSVAVAALGVLVGFLGTRDPIGKRMARAEKYREHAEKYLDSEVKRGLPSVVGRELMAQSELEDLKVAWMLRERNENARLAAKFGFALIIVGGLMGVAGILLDAAGWIERDRGFLIFCSGFIWFAWGGVSASRARRDAVTHDELLQLARGAKDPRPWWRR